MTTPTEDGFITVTLVCVGKVTLVGGGIGNSFREVDSLEDQILGHERVYSAKSTAGAGAGAMYAVPYNPTTGQMQWGPRKYKGSWPNSDQVGVWQAQSRAFDIKRRLANKEKSETAIKHLAEALAPLRREYVKTDAIGRLALEVQVLAYLRYGGTQ